jgi:hypothetical protein
MIVLDRLGEEVELRDHVKFRSWQGRDVFFTGTGHVQNIDPFGNIYVEPDAALHIEGTAGAFDATVLMVTTENEGGTAKAYKEHFSRPGVGETKSLGISWVEKTFKMQSQ